MPISLQHFNKLKAAVCAFETTEHISAEHGYVNDTHLTKGADLLGAKRSWIRFFGATLCLSLKDPW